MGENPAFRGTRVPVHLLAELVPSRAHGWTEGKCGGRFQNSLWTPAMLEQATVVDAQRGGVIGVSARKCADEQIVIAGGQVRATRYTFITPHFAGSIWYDKANLWVRGEFERDGSKVQYQLDA